MTPPEISVVVSVRGNARRLPTLLRALVKQTRTAFEVVIVDNDLTRTAGPRALHTARGPWPFPVRFARERAPGLSRGRNTGIRAARGELLAITDPDITPAPTWLQTLADTAHSTGAACVGRRAAGALHQLQHPRTNRGEGVHSRG